MAVATGLEADGVDRAIYLRLTQQGRNLLVQRHILRQICDLEPLCFCMGQTNRIDVTNNYYSSAQQPGRGCSGQPHRACTSDIHGATWSDASGYRSVIAGRKDVRQAGQVANFLHGTITIRQFQQIEVGVGDHHVLGLSPSPVTHVDVAIGAPRACRVYAQADTCVHFLTGTAAPAGHVERHRNQIAYFQVFDVTTFFDHLACDLVAKHQSYLCCGTSTDHVLV
ncbi:hypothetical protein D3C77_409820 [compost metagenome]